MSPLPRIAADGRGARIGLIAVLALGQACAAAWAAVAMRAVFAALHAADGAVPWAALGGIAGAGIAIALLKVLERIQAERVGQAYAASVRATLYRHLRASPPRPWRSGARARSHCASWATSQRCAAGSATASRA